MGIKRASLMQSLAREKITNVSTRNAMCDSAMGLFSEVHDLFF